MPSASLEQDPRNDEQISREPPRNRHCGNHTSGHSRVLEWKWMGGGNAEKLPDRSQSLFGFAVRQKYIRDNPTDAVEMPMLDDKSPGIISIADCRAVLDKCQRTDPGLLPFVALLFFTGLRSQEALRLDETNLNPDFVEVTARKSKTRQRRLIEISPQLRAWLDAGFQNGGTLPPTNWRKRWDRVRQSAGVFKGWPQNGARHSFVSYHLASFKSAAETAAIAGHSEHMLFAHYRELVTPADAEAFFGLMPDANAIAEGVEYSRLPKHVPPHLMRQRADEIRERLRSNESIRPCDVNTGKLLAPMLD
jgi:hypothetical protein